MIQPGPFGFPEEVYTYCHQTVGTSPVVGGWACAIPGHRADVESRSLRWSAPRRPDQERARFDIEEDARINAWADYPRDTPMGLEDDWAGENE
jgi:hypothetical protein